jgi:demethylmenaquinone methyltransferase / 2-methoxy-6-polyprenyl-1,4-benzoquinol methylase
MRTASQALSPEKEAQRKEKLERFWESDIQSVFSDVAEQYDVANDFASFGTWRRVQSQFIQTIQLFDDAEVLDLCAGTNAVGIDLLSKNGTIKLTAADQSEAMQKTGAARAAKKGFSIKSVITNAHDLPFDDNHFDVVTLKAATRHLEVPVAFRQVFRVLKPGGRFFHCDLAKPKSRLLTAIYKAYWMTMLPLTAWVFFRGGRFFKSKKEGVGGSQYFVDAIDLFYTPEEMTAVLEATGFKNIKVKLLFGGTVAIHQAQK